MHRFWFSGPKPPSRFSLSDVVILVALLMFGFYSRGIRIAFPRQRVFDEVHFGSFTNKYLNQSYFHDIHPPLGKMLLALSGWLAGYDGSIQFFGDKPYPNMHYVSLRLTPASFSAMIPAISFLSMKFFGFSAVGSIIAGLLLGIESMMIVESRLVLMDGILHFFAALTILAVSYYNAKPSLPSLILIGVAAGCTCSVKYTGASVLVFAGMSLLVKICKCSWNYLFVIRNTRAKSELSATLSMPVFEIAQKCLIFGGVCLFVVYAFFAIHICILSYEHSSDANFMPGWFKSTLIRKRDQRNRSNRIANHSVAKRVAVLVKAMHRSNMGITGEHSASSQWYKWPLVRMSALTYFSNRMSLLLFPNPVVWYPSSIGPVVCTLLAVWGYFSGNVPVASLIIWPVGYFSSLLPFALIPRVLFVYHYLVPLIFGVLSFCAAFDVILARWRKLRGCFLIIMMVSSIISWVFWAPWCYAMHGYDWNVRVWYNQFWK